MITYLKGKVLYKGNEEIILLTNNIGYQVFIPKIILNTVKEGEEIELYTYLIHKEDNLQLYGFKNFNERELFILFLTVNGVGPKMALNILSCLTISDIVYSILTNSYQTLTQVSGIGNKLAQRITLELKEKLKSWQNIVNITPIDSMDYDKEMLNEVLTIIKALGYSDKEINNIIDTIKPLCNSSNKEEDVIKIALEKLSI